MLLLNGKVTGQPGEPIAFETVFGWILMGPVDSSAQSIITAMCLSVSETFDLSIRIFWELEKLPVVHHLSPVLHRFSSFDKIHHIVAYCLHFSKSRPSAFTQIVNALALQSYRISPFWGFVRSRSKIHKVINFSVLWIAQIDK